ncbi:MULTISPECIES: molecular chaperone DnaK [unclassified Methanoregula]|uniref:molecular chaperone DnaK n=1 Tax=unclassified Methanoregula TaxID=2649730 RepID=UPI0009C6A9F0|nr:MULTISPECIES: molecular chaperone DnaK [unclassified Methanoregula]OPX65233.1 MAG: molecular chaperone DnaK [Methanoregula sp. PtaB.Bin085]OPY32142.1 MAG: molecular chaperone DnaK [Methanoregula sp. PtaU1.Bin006]
MSKEKIIGIDLGTSNSEAAVMVGGKPTIIPSAEGATVAGKMFPSYVAFTQDGQLLVGEPARRQAVSNPAGTITAAKRKMGTDHVYRIYNKEYTPQQISAFILQKIKRDAEAFLGEKVTKAVITVPAYFNDNQRTATKDAGKIAGLDVVRLVNEPTAASMAYGLDRGGEYKILVFDLGGGTLDVTIMEFGGGTFTVLATSGDTQLGGTDMDNAVFDWIADEFKKQEGIDLRADKMAVNRVREAAEKAKIELSTVMETEINLPYVSATQTGPKHLNIKLSRSKLEQLIDPIIRRCIKPFEQALKDANLTKDDIQKVILVGGPTRMPIVQKFIEDHVGKKTERGIDPMECVAMGAAIQGGILGGEIKDMVLLDVTPLTLGLETLGGVRTPLIDRNTTIPTKKSQIFSTAADMQTSVTIHVLQGERPMAADNVSLGQFNLVGLPPAPRGVPQIEVTFDIDASGILNVSAKDLGTGKEQKMTITASTKLSEADVRKMVDQAKEFEEQDKQKKEEVESRNIADSLVYTAEKTRSDLADKLSPEMTERLNGAITAAKAALDGKDLSVIKSETEKLQKVLSEAGSAAYQEAAKRQAQQQASSSGTETSSQGSASPGGENVVDADFKVKDEK